MNKIEFLHNIDKYKGEDHSTFLQHYGILGQKWGQRRWQNADGTFNEEGKIRYFGKSSKSSSSDEDKVSGMKSDVKDYLKFRNKMLKKRTTEELNKWYRENNKAADKQMLKDAKKVDKQRDKFYKNQLKDFYDDPNELVSDLDRIYKVGGKPDKKTEKLIKKNKETIDDLVKAIENNDAKELVKAELKFKNDEDWRRVENYVKDFMNSQGKNSELLKFWMDTEDISEKMTKNAEENSGQKLREEDEKLEQELLNLPRVKKHFEEMQKIYEKTGNWDDAEEYYWKQPELAEQDTWILDAMENHVDSLWDSNTHYRIGSSPKEAKKLAKEAEKFNKEFEKADFIKRQELLKNVINDKRYKPLFDQIDQNDTEKNKDNLKRIEEIFDDYKDKEIEHLATAGIMNMFTNGYYPNPTMEDVANCAWFYAYEDGNQGSNTAEYLYSTIDKGVKAEELVNLYNDLHRHSNIKEEAKATLKENPMLANVDERYLNRMINKKLDDKYSDNTGYWNLYAATEGSGEPTDKQRKDYKEAKKIATKLNSSCGNSNGWDYLNQAIENLDLSDKELKNMTQADWDRINAEINKLKK